MNHTMIEMTPGFLLMSLTSMAIASCFWVRVYIAFARSRQILDVPNERSSHTVAVARGGGAVVFALWSIGVVVASSVGSLDVRIALALVGGSSVVAIVGFLDDMRGLRARTRFVAHMVASLVCGVAVLLDLKYLNLGFLMLPLGTIGPALAFLAIVWSINLFNFMDGLDGLAASEAVWALGVGGYALWQAHGQGLAFCAWLAAAGACGFLVWNLPKAKVFMGDVGSGFFGFLIAAFALIGEVRYGVPVLIWVILYGVFFVDATITLIRRFVYGEKWYGAHRSHAFQRLHHGLGWSHARVLAFVSLINLMLAGLALWVIQDTNQATLALGLAFALLLGFYLLVERVAPMRQPRLRPNPLH